MGWGVMSFVCGISFLCGSTLVKEPLLQAGTIVILPQMFKSNVKPQQTKTVLCCKFINMSLKGKLGFINLVPIFQRLCFKGCKDL